MHLENKKTQNYKLVKLFILNQSLWTGLIGVGVERSEDRSSAASDDQRPMSA
jgi:hypothetical protein